MRRVSRRLVTLAALVGLVLPPWPASASAPGPVVTPVPAHAEVDGATVLVRFAPGASRSERAAALDRRGLGRGARHVGSTGFVEIPSAGRSRADLRAMLAGERGVLSIDAVLVRRAFDSVPDDPLFVEQASYLDTLRMPTAWDAVDKAAPRPERPVIAVIDSGVSPTHEDLAGRVLSGWDFVGDGPGDADAADEFGHGTRVAGVAAAATNNRLGIAGAAWNADILPVRVLDSSGRGTDVDVAEAIIWAADHGADVINLSLGGYGADAVTEAAVDHALAKDVVVVAAAGNAVEGLTRFKEPVYPAAFPGVIAVSATQDEGRSVAFSLFGPYVDIAAPGFAINATSRDGKYSMASGTSFSAPLVAGVAAIMRTLDPPMTQADVATRLTDTARDAGTPGFDDVYGHGILDAAAAVGSAPEQAPVPPTPGDAYEPNDSLVTARPIDAAISATIAPEGELDTYRIGVPAGSRVTVRVDPPPNGDVTRALDPILRVRAASGALVARRDDGGAAVSETITFDTSPGGTFFIEVENFLPTLGSGPYQLAVATSPLAPPTTAASATTTTAASPPPTTTSPPPPPPPPPTPTPPPAKSGYWMVGRDGAVYGFGDAHHHGRISGMPRGIEAVDLEPTPTLGGYWIVTNAGHVHAFGDAPYLGGLDGALAFGEAVTSISRTPSGRGYWIFTTKGRVVPFGDAAHHGDMRGTALNGPVLDSIPSPSGNGYYMVASDGGIFTFGDAVFQGSMGGIPLNAPVQSLVPDADGTGYWLVASDGGIFSFDAPFRGSMGDVRLNGPITGMVRFGNGYLMVGTDGGIFTFTDKEFYGSLGANPPASPIVSVAAAEG